MKQQNAATIKDAVNTALVTMRVADMGSVHHWNGKTFRYVSCADTAKLIRQVLKAAFPGTKFSVRSHVYSGGASIDIRWRGGPPQKDVESAVYTFEGATFDGMTDSKDYKSIQVGNEEVHFGADFIFCHREEEDEENEKAS